MNIKMMSDSEILEKVKNSSAEEANELKKELLERLEKIKEVPSEVHKSN